jgi:hypothetical protein
MAHKKNKQTPSRTLRYYHVQDYLLRPSCSIRRRVRRRPFLLNSYKPRANRCSWAHAPTTCMRRATKGTRGRCERLNYRRSCVTSFSRRRTRTLALRDACLWPTIVRTFSMAILPPPYPIYLLIISTIPFISTLSTLVMAPCGHARNSDLSCSRPPTL